MALPSPSALWEFRAHGWSIYVNVCFFYDLLKCCIMFCEIFLSSPLELGFSHGHHDDLRFLGFICHFPTRPELISVNPGELRLKTKKL